MPPLFGYEGGGKFWGEPDEFDPWKTSIGGVKIMSPEEDAAWRRFEHAMQERHGFGWKIELDASPPPSHQRMLDSIRRIGQAQAEEMTNLAIEVLGEP